MKFGEPSKSEKNTEAGMCKSGKDKVIEVLSNESPKYYSNAMHSVYEFPVLNFFRALTLCHSVLIQGKEYQASSPDELALVQGAKEVGLEFTGR